MGVTAIKHFDNESAGTVVVRNVERAQRWEINSGATMGVDIWIPWCVSQVDFDHNHYLMIEFSEPARTYWVWQSNEAWQDRVRYHTEAKWKPEASPVPGTAEVNGDRSVEFRSDGTISFSRVGEGSGGPWGTGDTD
jgi:hypothetical protein